MPVHYTVRDIETKQCRYVPEALRQVCVLNADPLEIQIRPNRRRRP